MRMTIREDEARGSRRGWQLKWNSFPELVDIIAESRVLQLATDDRADNSEASDTLPVAHSGELPILAIRTRLARAAVRAHSRLLCPSS